MPTVTTTNLSNIVKVYYDRRMLERLTPQLMFHQFGDRKEIPKKEGTSVYWHRWNLFTYGRNLAESGAGTARGISATRVSATLVLFGDHVKVTTYLDMVSINSVVEGAVDLFADSAALTVDFITSRQLLWRLTSLSASLQLSTANGYYGDKWQLLTGGAHVAAVSSTKWQAPLWHVNDLTSRNHSLSSGCKAPGATGLCSAQITPRVLRTLALKLKVKNARKFEDGYYKAIIHPDKVHELRSSSAFIDLHKYTESMVKSVTTEGSIGGGKREVGLVGIMEQFKFYESTEAPLLTTSGVFGGTADGRRAQPSAYGGGRFYFTFFFGKNAYGVTDFDGGVNTFIKVPGPQSTDNPLNLYSTVGYRCIMTAKILNPSACLWLISGANAGNVGDGG